MSVPKNQRSESRLEVYHNAKELRNQIILLLLRDFGVKDKIRNTKILAKIHNIDPGDEEALRKILEKYNMEDSIIEEYPEWIIDKMRSSIWDCADNLVKNFRAANSIYPVSETEYYQRRTLQDMAIANCDELLEEMQLVIEILPVDVNKYRPYVEMIEKEVALLKGWRKSDNKILRRIREQGKDGKKKK